MNKLTRFGGWYKKNLEQLVPAYSLFPLLFCFVWNVLIYVYIGRFMAGARHYDLTTGFDRAVPFVTWWVYIYLGCYLFWVVNYILAGREGRESCYRFCTVDIVSRTVCGVIFILLPTTNVRPEVTGSGFADMLMRFVFDVDPPVNLFPSIHCIVSWMCVIGIRRSRKIPFWYKVLSVIMAVLVMVSTQLTKQHYIADVVSGVALAEICLAIEKKTNLYRVFEKGFRAVEKVIFGVCGDD